MTNLETEPAEIVCTREEVRGAQVLEPRDVPLGGPRAMNVRRTLPQRRRSLIGSWCFADHYGPDLVSESGGMRVARHPHTGLATVSLLFTGGIDHLDSAGNAARVRPGEVNLMIAGRGISHQEFSTPETTTLHGVQLWYALPDATRHRPPSFEHHAPEPVHPRDGAELRVYLGSLAGSTSPVRTSTLPLLAAEILLQPGTSLDLDVDRAFEHGVLLDAGTLDVDGTALPQDHLAYLPPGRAALRLTAGDAAGPVRALLIGGVPLGEQIVMWWNFVGRTHDEVVAYRDAWQAEIGAEAAAQTDADERFGPYPAGQPAPLPAPALPTVRLRPRG
ncbi:pirin family protein [Tersicoccus sp. MR15.9]|uniref:pirin family protein n=1 Tax=Tersicoccus mangrovi TaxID=3121635 RepID=UPI002FE6BBA6